MSTVVAVVVGGLVSLISTLIALVVQHFLSLRRMLYESKKHPSQVLYNKQIELVEQLTPVLDGIRDRLKREPAKAKDDADLAVFDQVFRKYRMYMPGNLMDKVYDLLFDCSSLPWSDPNFDRSACLFSLFETENLLREFIGVDKLSKEREKALRQKSSEKPKEGSK